MEVTIEVDSGVAMAFWCDETGAERDEFIGEISDRWIENEAESYFAKRLGEDILITVVILDEELPRYRQILENEVTVDRTVYIYGDDKEYHEMTIDEVLRPSDQYKAFVASDGCRYGLDGTFIKETKWK